MAIMDDILAVMKYVGGLSPQNVHKAQAEAAKFRNADVLQGDAGNPGTVMTMLRRLGRNGKGIAGMRGVLKMEGIGDAGKDIGTVAGNIAEMDPARVVNMAQMFDADKAARTYTALSKVGGPTRLPGVEAARQNGQVSLADMVNAMVKNVDMPKRMVDLRQIGPAGGADSRILQKRIAQELDTLAQFVTQYAKGSKLK